jgi:acyl-CoA dehydrogenase
MALPRLSDDEPGTRLTNLEFTGVAEVLGRLEWASRVFNCHAPDVPNMELLQLFATEQQKSKWLVPLLNGEIGSSFAMTEPLVASSDPTNLTTSIVRDGDEYVINGRKWFASNASHEKCELIVVVGVTDGEAPKSKRQSLFLVPRNSPGINFMRNLPVFDHMSATNLHPEFEMKDVRVPVENLLGELGAGFAIGQARLGPARLHHCMRAIGECELDQVRLLVQRAAHQLDTIGNKAARKQISMIKVAVARTYLSIADRAVQLHGAKGVTNDTPAARAFNKARAFRIYDGPDEVHLQTIARIEAGEQDLSLMDHYLS